MYLHELRSGKNARKKAKRVGRGGGSGHGKTSCRGHKGHRARSGGTLRPGFEGGQTPLARRLPKRGFRRTSPDIQIVNLKSLTKFKEDVQITPEILASKQVISSANKRIKILGEGKISKPLNIKAHSFSQSAKNKIEEAGGKIEIINA